MIDPETCRAARGLLNWSQQHLAQVANIGVSTVKNFEGGHRTPTSNNLGSIQYALEHGGVEFVSEEQGGPGVLKRRVKKRAYIPGKGLMTEIHYVDGLLAGPDNQFDPGFCINEEALAAMLGRPVLSQADAKSVPQRKLLTVLRFKINREGPSSPGGISREITKDDVLAAGAIS